MEAQTCIKLFTHHKSLQVLLSSNIIEGIKAVCLFFCTKDFTHTKSTKSTKRKQATFTQTFYTRIKSMKNTKSIKSTKRQTSDSLPLRCFYRV